MKMKVIFIYACREGCRLAVKSSYFVIDVYNQRTSTNFLRFNCLKPTKLKCKSLQCENHASDPLDAWRLRKGLTAIDQCHIAIDSHEPEKSPISFQKLTLQ